MTASKAALNNALGSAWHVNVLEVVKHLGHVTNAGTPVSSLTPEFLGQVCFDTTGLDWYIATALTSADWVVMGFTPDLSKQIVLNAHAKVGTTAGWLVNAADNLGILARVPASETAVTLVIPVTGLEVGDTITGFSIAGQIESGGNTCTLDANLRKLTAAAGAVTDASIASITQISVTADTIIADSVGSLTEVLAADETLYLLLTATTGVATDIDLMSATVTVTRA